MKDNPSVKECYDLCFSMHQTCNAIMQACWNKARNYGISPTGAMVLYAIQRLDGEAGPTEISRVILRKPNSVSELISRMEKAGILINAGQLRSDAKRVRKVKLTKKGLEIHRSLFVRGSIPQLVSAFSGEEMQALKSFLEKLQNCLPGKPLPETRLTSP